MIELLFVTCLSTAPDQCQNRSLLFAPEVGLMTCMIQGQSQLAQWSRTHPSETVRKWGCRIRARGEVAI